MATIYKLICDDPELVYYGSTTEPLWKRFSAHKTRRNCSSKKLFDVGGVKIEELEKCKVEDRFIREDYYIRNFSCVNEKSALRTPEQLREWCRLRAREDYEKRKPYHQEYMKEYNKKKYAPIECECGKKTSLPHLERHKQSQKHQVYEFLKQIEESNVAMPE